jgi:hypothetical protein
MIKTKGVSHCGLVIYIEKYLKVKEELGQCKNVIFKEIF